MSLVRNIFTQLNKNKEMGLIAFMMAGVPDEKISLDCIKALEQGGCDLLELGVPFTDPVADGKILERFHHQGINNGINLNRCLEFTMKVIESINIPIILFSYLNPIYKKGIKEFMINLRSIGIESIVVPDIPLDELYRLNGFGVEIIPMVAPSSSAERLELAAKQNSSFIYCVSTRGTTGVKHLAEEEIKNYLLQVKQYSNSPLALGFGISEPIQIKKFIGFSDAVVIGSHFAHLIEQNIHDNIPLIIENETIRFKKVMR